MAEKSQTLKGATEHLRRQAKRIVGAALERAPLRAAMLVGSGARGDADFYSDLDLLLYLDELPPEGTLREVIRAVGGTNPIVKGEPSDHFYSEEFDLDGIRTEVSFALVRRAEQRLDELLNQFEEFDSPRQKILSGFLECLPLYGEDLIEAWRARAREYPESFRRTIIERHWNFFPIWYYGDAMAARDAELWRLDVLLEASFNLLAVLAALNRLYYTRFELKRMRNLISKMELAPVRLANRLESLFRLESDAAAAELGRLIEETRALVSANLPELELPLGFQPGTSQPRWTL